MTDRFDLEQCILQYANVTDDLQLLLDSWQDLNDDARQKTLQGIITLYSLKFEKLWSTFESCSSNREI